MNQVFMQPPSNLNGLHYKNPPDTFDDAATEFNDNEVRGINRDYRIECREWNEAHQ